MSDVERTTKLATTVPDLPRAWAFVMDSLEHVGPEPTISIEPVTAFEDSVGRYFEVAVEGTVTQEDA